METVKSRITSQVKAANGFLDVEICNYGKTDYSGNVRLYDYRDIPNFLSGNPFILRGYRANLPISTCIRSLFMWSNETINIWSHLLGFLLFFCLMINDLVFTLPSYKTHVTDYIVITFGLLCFQYCMLCSTGYHIFNCHSEKCCQWWLGIDMAGISVGVIGCYIPALYYAYYCITIWRDIYMFTIAVLTLGTLILQREPEFKTRRWFKIRVLIYIALTAIGVIPTIHWIYLNDGFNAFIVQLFIPKIIVLYLLGMVALTFYLSKFPERYYPGTFDMIGSSHQCWHFVVVLAFIWCYYSGQEILLYRIHNTCIL
ncbi:hypothetical protein LOTGIDRAFT_144778 [Lottia gigantea]|uniref:Progestin and adipoQ receptor family member 3 n=1 Tax=Lottia gigantea TaxID=225164 RepID=V4C0H9_LOTGI|nr:hypothetical protein LOTGIDRAFT_144778 [Lottia gigantea]ESO94939.1 hypothetical protein LOTGIDRAFT_144778 [Lottia gigantea]